MVRVLPRRTYPTILPWYFSCYKALTFICSALRCPRFRKSCPRVKSLLLPLRLGLRVWVWKEKTKGKALFPAMIEGLLHSPWSTRVPKLPLQQVWKMPGSVSAPDPAMCLVDAAVVSCSSITHRRKPLTNYCVVHDALRLSTTIIQTKCPIRKSQNRFSGNSEQVSEQVK